MAGINRVGSGVPAAPGGRPPRGSGTSFRLPQVAGGDPASGAQATAPVIPLESLLALQQVDSPSERDRAAHQRGQALLAALTGLQRTLLEDGDPAAVLAELGRLAVDVPVAADPGLAAALNHVVLRARIEIVRREVEPSPEHIIANH